MGAGSRCCQAEPARFHLRAAWRLDVDPALIDLDMPGAGGFGRIATLRSRDPALPLVAALAQEDPALVQQLIALGAAGYPRPIPRASWNRR